LTKLNTSKQHLIKFIFNESSVGIYYCSQRRNLANDFWSTLHRQYKGKMVLIILISFWSSQKQ
jgi:hypothetical protein